MDGGNDEVRDGGREHTGKPSTAIAVRHSRSRKRKGSLRKAALAKVRERSAKSRQEQDAVTVPSSRLTASATLHPPGTGAIYTFEPSSSLDSAKADEDSSVASSETSLDESDHARLELVIPSINLNSTTSYASTTDEDDAQLPHSSASISVSSLNLVIPNAMSVSRRRSSRSILGALTAPSAPLPPSPITSTDTEWDYTETARWGWFILLFTWLVFVIVMGSCFGVWSWVWDVGETPYAPPELEDDATLPITGYYPALMVCTAVMSWVWVVVAWVGMKYFRHAKVVGDEG